MDILSIVGFFGAFVVLVVGCILKGSTPSSLIGSAAFVIVICGTTCSCSIPNACARSIVGRWC